jgi:hypothetical protein
MSVLNSFYAKTSADSAFRKADDQYLIKNYIVGYAAS